MELVTSFSTELARVIQGADPLEGILSMHTDLFKDKLGKIMEIIAKLYLKPDAQFKFCGACPAYCSVRDLVENKISRQVKDGMLEPVEFSD